MLEKAIEITPADYQIWFNLGNTYVLLKEQQKSIHAYTKALETAEQELVEDLFSIMASFAGKLYGMRSHKQKALLECAQNVLGSP